MGHLAGGYPRLIEPTRTRLTDYGRPWAIENVDGAPLPVQDTLDGAHGTELCGSMFGLRVYRHRLFETSFSIAPPPASTTRRFPLNRTNRRAPRRCAEISAPIAPTNVTCHGEMSCACMSV